MPDETRPYDSRRQGVPPTDQGAKGEAGSEPSIPALDPTVAATPAGGSVSVPPAVPMELPAGTWVGEYRVTHKLGEGGMGTVYAGDQPTIGKRVAIKVLAPHGARDPDLVRRFVEEARAANRISHPHIIDIFSFCQLPDGRHCFIMEFLDGESLAEAIEGNRLQPQELRRLLGQICGALEATHQVGIVHRDLKPENIWVARPPHGDSYVKLLDFGIAKLMDPTRTNLTQTGAVMGTPLFMSPEQCLGRAVDARTDIYALGVILYRIFSGRYPFNGAVITELVFHHVTTAPPRPSLYRPMPAELETLLLDCLAKDPADRPASARALGDRLVAALAAWPGLSTDLPTPGASQASATLPPAVAHNASELRPTYRPAGRSGGRAWLWVGGACCAGAVVAALALHRPSAKPAIPSTTTDTRTATATPIASTGIAAADAAVQGQTATPSPKRIDRPRAPAGKPKRSALPPVAAPIPPAPEPEAAKEIPRPPPVEASPIPVPPTRAHERGLIEKNPLK